MGTGVDDRLAADTAASAPAPLALSIAEQAFLLAVLVSERFVDMAPAAVFATLLDEGLYYGSIRTMYRLLAAASLTGERRPQRVHPVYAKPELLAIAPNEVWSWDITKLKGPGKWTYFQLYVILDIYSRYVVGYDGGVSGKRRPCRAADRRHHRQTEHRPRNPHPARRSGQQHALQARGGLTRGSAGGQNHSRPHVSDDNPFSEAQFKTMKYRPDFPERFGSIEYARVHCQAFFSWYNTEHHHSGIALMSPEVVHHGRAVALTARRATTLDAAFIAHPNRFKGVQPQPPRLPDAVSINPPERTPLNPPSPSIVL